MAHIHSSILRLDAIAADFSTVIVALTARSTSDPLSLESGNPTMTTPLY